MQDSFAINACPSLAPIDAFPSLPLELPAWVESLSYTQSFQQAKDDVICVLRQYQSARSTLPIDFSRIEACVAIKNREGETIQCNGAFQYFTPKSEWRAQTLPQAILEVLNDGVTAIDCEHFGWDLRGNAFTFQTHCRRLDEFRDSQFFMLSVSRPVSRVTEAKVEPDRSLSELYLLFQSLDSIDQQICRLDAKGEATKDIATSVSMSTRSVENRRNKMLAIFGVERTMELIRITIRLEEHGLLPS